MIKKTLLTLACLIGVTVLGLYVILPDGEA